MEQEHTVEVAPSRTGMSRRVVVKSAAWSVPVFATVGVTPAFAATPELPPAIVSGGGTTATRTGSNVNFTWEFTKADDVTITSVSIATDKTSGNAKFNGPTGSLTTTSPITWSGSNNNAANKSTPGFTITIRYTRSGDPTNELSAIVRVDGSTGFDQSATLGTIVALN